MELTSAAATSAEAAAAPPLVPLPDYWTAMLHKRLASPSPLSDANLAGAGGKGRGRRGTLRVLYRIQQGTKSSTPKSSQIGYILTEALISPRASAQMGTRVLNISSSSPDVRVYAHCSRGGAAGGVAPWAPAEITATASQNANSCKTQTCPGYPLGITPGTRVPGSAIAILNCLRLFFTTKCETIFLAQHGYAPQH